MADPGAVAERSLAARSTTPAPSASSRLAAASDALLDGLVVAFAVWTLLYEALLATQRSLWAPSALWLAVTVVGVAAHVVRSVRRPGPPPERPAPDAVPRGTAYAARFPRWVWPATLVGLVLVLGAHYAWGGVPLTAVVVAATAVLAAGVVESLRPRAAGPQSTVPGVWSHLGAWLVAAGLGVLSAFLVLPNADDVFYVNRSVWVAEHGYASLRDTMFGPGTFPSSYQGGLPLASVEGLFGGLAHVFGTQSGVVVYVVATPILSVLAGLATWRLVRAWAARRHLLAFLVAVAFMMLTAPGIAAGFSINRIWEGKVTAYAVLLPLIWCYLGQARDRFPRREVLLLLGAGVCFVGLSSTAAIQAPMIAVPAVAGALLLRRPGLAWAGAALVVAPVVSGLVQLSAASGVGGPDPVPDSLVHAWVKSFGLAPSLVLLGVLAYTAGVLLPRGRQAVVVALAAAAGMASLLPGVFYLFNRLTGAGPVEWRLLLGVPIAVLVGLAVTIPPRRAPGRGPVVARIVAPAFVVPALVVAVLLAQGLPPWDSNRHAHLASPSAWKVPPAPLARTQEVLRAEETAGPGPWLLPAQPMQVLPLLTTTHSSVVPRRFYVNDLPEPGADRAARLVLWRLARSQGHVPSPERIRQALLQLQVSLACVTRRDPVRVDALDAAAGLPGQRVAGLDCHLLHVRRPGEMAAGPLTASGAAVPSPRRTGSPRPAPSPGSAGASAPAGRPARAR